MVSLEKANTEDAVEIHKFQKLAFAKLLEKYQDFETNPGADTLEKIRSKLNRNDTEYYFIKNDEDKLGVTYKAITNYMEGKEVSEKDRKTIERLHKNTHHKFNIPTYRREEN